MKIDTNKTKDIKTYINLDENINNDFVDMITVEHRSANKKRDYLFVNKNQCKHIPCSPTLMSEMCKQLAKQIDSDLAKDDTVAIIGFAETATAIAEMVANKIKSTKSVYLIKTTRENIHISTPVVKFEEEHSHATEQMLLTYGIICDDSFDINKFNTVIFIDDEITTGKTIINCIKELNKKADLDKIGKITYRAASICNWQNSENKKQFRDKNIKTYSLISGEIKDKDQKMQINEDDIDNGSNEKSLYDTYSFTKIDIKDITETFNRELFFRNRFGYWINNKSKRQDKMLIRILTNFLEPYISRKVSSIRIIGTEEFMYLPIKLGMKLEKLGYEVICHSTTRSKIDILKMHDTKTTIHTLEENTLINRNDIISPYDCNRKTYLYNTNTYTDIVLVLTDALDESVDKFIVNIPEILNYKPSKIIFIQV